ncbi:MAG TPA: hypothetical protein VFM76_07000, partial [Methylophaga sp.]|nr:hypothetical protein [Methylophaga sp.]
MTSARNSFEQLLTTFDLTFDRSSLSLCNDLLTEADQRQSTDQAAHMGGQLYPAAIAGKLLATLHQGNLLSAELHPQLQQIETTLLADMAAQFNFPL